MIRPAWLALLLLIPVPHCFAVATVKVPEPAPWPGALFIVGGGAIPDALREEAIALAGGANSRLSLDAVDLD